MNRITTCPNCSTRLRVSEHLTDKTLTCPHCLWDVDVDNPQPGFQIQAADINTDVKRDVNVGCIVLAVLIGLCVLGIATAIFHMGDSDDSFTLFMESSAALGLLLIIAIIYSMVRSARSGKGGAHVSILAGVLGIALTITLFVLVTIVAFVIFVLASCSKMLGH